MNDRGTSSPPAQAQSAPTVQQPIELAMLARQAGVRVSLVRRYVAFGLFDACAGTSQAPLFEPDCAARLAKAERLRRDLGLNYSGAVLACELLDRLLELEAQVRTGQ